MSVDETGVDPVVAVRDALASGELGLDDLSARRLGAFVGKTTSVLYHHWGSLDGFLYAVAEAGYELLIERLAPAMRRGALPAVAVAFVDFGLAAPALYALMFERRYDWDALREAGAFADTNPGHVLWQRTIDALGALGSDEPEGDARLLFAGLHGLVSLAASGRANIGALEVPDRDVARASARRLVSRLMP